VCFLVGTRLPMYRTNSGRRISCWRFFDAVQNCLRCASRTTGEARQGSPSSRRTVRHLARRGGGSRIEHCPETAQVAAHSGEVSLHQALAPPNVSEAIVRNFVDEYPGVRHVKDESCRRSVSGCWWSEISCYCATAQKPRPSAIARRRPSASCVGRCPGLVKHPPELVTEIVPERRLSLRIAAAAAANDLDDVYILVGCSQKSARATDPSGMSTSRP
jgi:hypothetical protein